MKGPKGRYVIAILARRIADKQPGVDNEALRTGAELLAARLRRVPAWSGCARPLTSRAASGQFVLSRYL